MGLKKEAKNHPINLIYLHNRLQSLRPFRAKKECRRHDMVVDFDIQIIKNAEGMT
jgi:hypothetical protein